MDRKLKEFAPFDRWAEELRVKVSSTVTLPLEISHLAVMYLLIIDLRKTIYYIIYTVYLQEESLKLQ